MRKSKVADPFGDDIDISLNKNANKPFETNRTDPFDTKRNDPFADNSNVYGGNRPLKSKDPFAPTPDPFEQVNDPFANKPNKIKDPFADTDTESHDK